MSSIKKQHEQSMSDLKKIICLYRI